MSTKTASGNSINSHHPPQRVAYGQQTTDEMAELWLQVVTRNCTQVLHLSEHAAYGRIEAARAARRFPVILDRLIAGEITMTGIGLLTSHLTPENHRELLDAARHRSKRDVEHLIATLRPQPPVPSSVRKLPSVQPLVAAHTARPCEMAPAADPAGRPLAALAVAQPSARLPVIRALAPERYKVQFTVDGETFEKLRRVQDLMRHRVPDGDVAVIFDRALTLLLEHLDRTKLASTHHPRVSRGTAQRSRNIPAGIRERPESPSWITSSVRTELIHAAAAWLS